MFKNLAAGGQTTAHGVRMLRQVIKIGFSISMVFGLLYFGWFLYQQPQENYKAFYYLVKSKITFEETVLVRAESWKEINRTPKKKSSKKTPAQEEPNYGFASEDTPEYKNRMLKIKKATVIKACEKRIRFFKGEAIEEGKNAPKSGILGVSAKISNSKRSPMGSSLLAIPNQMIFSQQLHGPSSKCL